MQHLSLELRLALLKLKNLLSLLLVLVLELPLALLKLKNLLPSLLYLVLLLLVLLEELLEIELSFLLLVCRPRPLVVGRHSQKSLVVMSLL